MSTDFSSELSPDVVFEILSSRRRRMVLFLLRDRGGSATVNDLAEEIAALENDVDVEELTSQQQKRVYVSLYQTHLPKLEQTGIIDYDVDEGEVHLTDKVSEVDSYLTRTTEQSYPWAIHYGVLSAVSGLLVVLWGLGVPGITAIPFVWLGVGIVVAFAASALVHYWRYQQLEDEIPAELSRKD